jgi:hypothetical protein
MLHNALKMYGIHVSCWTLYKNPAMAAVWYRSHPKDKAAYDTEMDKD